MHAPPSKPANVSSRAFYCLSQDLMTVEADRILDTVVSWTMVNGEVVYTRNTTKAP